VIVGNDLQNSNIYIYPYVPGDEAVLYATKVGVYANRHMRSSILVCCGCTALP
jgi:hypothetical protein